MSDTIASQHYETLTLHLRHQDGSEMQLVLPSGTLDYLGDHDNGRHTLVISWDKEQEGGQATFTNIKPESLLQMLIKWKMLRKGMASTKRDSVPDSQLPYLTTEELNKIYLKRREIADAAHGQLMMRVWTAQRAEEMNKLFAHLLVDCARAFEAPIPTLDSLIERIKGALDNYEELFGELDT